MPNARPLAILFWSLVVTTVLTALLVAATVWIGFRAQTEDEWVRHTLAVRFQIGTVFALVQRAESGQRGFLLTGRNAYLEPHNVAVASLPAALNSLSTLVSDNAKQQREVSRLRQLILDKLDELRETVAAYQAGKHDDVLAIMNSDRGLQMMSGIREAVSSMQIEENRLLSERQTHSAQLSTALFAGAGATFLLIVVIGVLVTTLARRSFTTLTAARDQLLATNRDLQEQIAQREQAESQLRQSQKMQAIGALTGGIAHDFNNMLGVIAGALDLIQRRIRSGNLAIERYTDAAQEATKRAASLTHRLLAFARKQPLAPEPLLANKMIGNMSDILRSTLGEHIQIETVFAGGLWTTHADANQLENAILNVAINGRDAMPEGGKLTIETANAYLDEAYCREHAEIEPGQFVMVAVSDTGTGMSPEVIARAFDPFFTTKPVGSGTGLGLSQVYGFVKQSRGHIKIYSEIGAGTTVKIYLPRFMGEAQDGPRVASPPIQSGQINEVILLVEDDVLMRRLATELLRELGYTVIHSESAAKALEVLEGRPDIRLLFTDVVMPVTNGKQLADEAKRRRPDLKVLFTTGYTPNAVVHGGVLDAGVNFIGKPFTLEQLAAKVRAVLDA